MYAKISSPSRPASHALTKLSTSSRFISLRIRFSCFFDLASRGTRWKLSGTIGRSAIRHFLNFSSYSSGSASWTRCPTAHVITYYSDSRYPSSFSNFPGSAPARSRPTEGFSATTRVLAIDSPYRASVGHLQRHCGAQLADSAHPLSVTHARNHVSSFDPWPLGVP